MSKFTIVNPVASTEGRAIVIDMSSAGPAFNGKHMTLFFCPYGFGQQDLQAVNDELSRTSQASFTLTPWGQKSDLIKGELEELGTSVRTKFPQWLTRKDRPFHVQMR